MKEGFIMMYKNIVDLINKEAEKRFENTLNYMDPNKCEYAENTLERNSTTTRWTQYKNGTITREKAVEYATKRIRRDIDKSTTKKFDKLLQAVDADEITTLEIFTKWNRSSTWGYNPSVTVYATTRTGKTIKTYGYASGCGYDKKSTAIAEALNQIPGLLKDLYAAKENAINAGTTPTNEINESNEKYIAYGAGYGALPYFEGGCGTNSTLTCIEKCGFKVISNHDDFIYCEREV
jgi:hypothetical protein